MTRQLTLLAAVLVAPAVFSLNTFAVTLNGEYLISTNITNNGSNTYTFDYYVTNNNQAVNP